MPTRPQIIAVVEDDEDMRTGISRLLSVSGYQTEIFASAEEFLVGVAKSHATCLLLDIHLGGLSGIELRRQLSASGSRLPVIFMTAIDDEALHRDALAAGCVALLRKPFTARVLDDAITKATA